MQRAAIIVLVLAIASASFLAGRMSVRPRILFRPFRQPETSGNDIDIPFGAWVDPPTDTQIQQSAPDYFGNLPHEPQ
ncbi:MAG: hypothetical protein AAFP90_07380 [Planctomycetota bacterium]